jgi:hypothetical protein
MTMETTAFPPGLKLHQEALPLELQALLQAEIPTWLKAGRAGLLHGSTYSPVPTNFAVRHQSREMLQYGVYTVNLSTQYFNSIRINLDTFAAFQPR